MPPPTPDLAGTFSPLGGWYLGGGYPSAGPTGPTELEPAIVAALKGSPELAALCGERIYPAHIPEISTLPALSYQVTREDRVTSLRGAAGLRRVAFEFECRSPRKAEVRDIREVVRQLFQGYIGTLGRVKVKYVSLEGETDDYEQPTPGADDGTYAKTITFSFVVRESIPDVQRTPPPATEDGAAELEPAIVAALKGSAALAALCGDRVYPSRIPEISTLPALSYQLSRADRETSLRGAAGLRRVDVRFECRSPTKADVLDIREVVRNRFQGLIGKLGQVDVKYVSLDDESDDYEQPTPGADDGTYEKTFTLGFVLNESIPVFA